jgi:4-hydroxybenzoate polyprenyltransferase
MRTFAITLFIIGAVPFASGIIYYLIDYKRTGKLYRKKLPWFPIIIVGWVFAAAGVLTGIFATGGPGLS